MNSRLSIKELARENRILDGLSDVEFEKIVEHLTPVYLRTGDVLHEADEPVEYCYFPTTAVISMMSMMENGDTTELAPTGSEGLSGICGYLGEGTPPTRVIAQVAGNALRIPIVKIRERFSDCGDFQRILLRYAQYLIAQISQSAACNRLHPVEKQFCRWLLINDDIHRGNNLRMTHELVASMLGCSRVSISVTAAKFQKRGWITYTRGVIKITDRQGLLDAGCECYLATVSHYERIFTDGCTDARVIRNQRSQGQ